MLIDVKNKLKPQDMALFLSVLKDDDEILIDSYEKVKKVDLKQTLSDDAFIKAVCEHVKNRDYCGTEIVISPWDYNDETHTLLIDIEDFKYWTASSRRLNKLLSDISKPVKKEQLCPKIEVALMKHDGSVVESDVIKDKTKKEMLYAVNRLFSIYTLKARISNDLCVKFNVEDSGFKTYEQLVKEGVFE